MWPLYTSAIVPASTDFVRSGAGSIQAIPTANVLYYHLLTGKTSAGTGRSFLNLLGALLTTSSGSVTWTVTMNSSFRVLFAHNGGGAIDLSMDAALAWLLGFNTTYAPGVTNTSVGVTSAGVLTSFPPVWLWNPDRWISNTGPQLFDPAFEPGIRMSNGAVAAFAPDNTGSFVSNGESVEAVHMFRGVEPYYRAHPTTSSTELVHQREDFVTWWKWGPKLGRRILYWRNRDNCVGTSAPVTAGIPAKYVEYYPAAALQKGPDIVATAPPRLVQWDITIPMRLTERGEAVY